MLGVVTIRTRGPLCAEVWAPLCPRTAGPHAADCTAVRVGSECSKALRPDAEPGVFAGSLPMVSPVRGLVYGNQH